MARKLGAGARSRLGVDRDIRELGGEARGRTITAIRRDTIYAGRSSIARDRVAKGNTLSGGGRFDTIYAGRRFDTIYAGRRFDTIYAGRRFDTVYGGGRFDTVYGGGSRRGTFPGMAGRGADAVTRTVVDPQTRQVRSVVYNTATGQYLDTNTRRWMPAPRWMRAQLG